MTTPMISNNWATILEPGLRAIFMQQVDAGNVGGPGVTTLYGQTTSNRAFEEVLGIGGLADVPEFKGAIEYDTFDEQWKATYTHVEFAKGVAVERKLVDDDQYGVINQRTTMLGATFARTRRKSAAKTFIDGFSAIKTPDGKALFATDHPISKQGRGTAQSNRGTIALSYDSVITTREAMMGFTDDRGQIANINPDTIVVPLALEATAWTIVNSMSKPGTANNDGNFAGSLGWNVVVDRYLTSSKNWYMVDSTMSRMQLWWFDRVAPEFAVDPKSDFDLVARYRGYMRYSYGPADWRWAYGHIVA